MSNRPSSVGLNLYVSSVVLLGGLAFARAYGFTQVGGGPISVLDIVTFTGLGVLLEIARHRLKAGTVTGSISFVVFIGATLVFGPLWGAITAAVSMGLGQVLNRRPPVKTLFNVSQCMLSVVLGAEAYVALGGQIPASNPVETFVPFVGFVLTFFLVNSVAVSAAVALSERRRFVDVWVANTLNLAEYDLIASVLALGIAILYVRLGILGAASLIVPILFVRHTYAVNLQLQETNRELLDLMVKAIEARDPYTSGHSQRVAEIAHALARELHLGYKEVDNITTAALLHDVGKIYEEFAPLLRKVGRLTAEERHVMETHPARSAELVGTISSLQGYVYKCVRHHHENYDGTGYPDGLAASQIPTGARIIMVADTVDAMTTDRPYRRALPYEAMLLELTRLSGRQFDPQVVNAFHRSATVRRLVQERMSSVHSPESVGPEATPQLAAR